MGLKIVTYNIDGLPDKLDLSDLPFIFKPIVWIYKLIKHTTIVEINDNNNKSENTIQISKKLNELHADIIGLQEDFNYHNELISNSIYNYNSEYSGGFNIKNIFKSIKWFPYPRFKANGLTVLTKGFIIGTEVFYPWKKSYGYFTHANDKLTIKGFKHITLYNNNLSLGINLYVIHMDADFYHPINCPDISGDIKARQSQLKQLTKHILETCYMPVIIMGDTNSSPNYEWDNKNIQSNLIDPINSSNIMSITEATPNDSVDRVFIINNLNCHFNLSVENCGYDNSFNGLSDHLPFIVNLKVEVK